jgi:excisionase family DNA binding protein
MIEYLSLDQLSAYCGLHRNTLKSWMKEGMPFYRIGRSVRVKREEFDRWVQRFKAVGTTQGLGEIMREAEREVP